jgi:hypothetical protein
VRGLAFLAAMEAAGYYSNCKKTDGICEGICDGEVSTSTQICPFPAPRRVGFSRWIADLVHGKAPVAATLSCCYY